MFVQQIRMGFTTKQPGACAKLTKVSHQLLFHAGDRLTGLGIKPYKLRKTEIIKVLMLS